MKPFKITRYTDFDPQRTRHRILRSWLGRTFDAKEPRQIVDWSCGCGIGTEGLRKDFPDWRFLMVDIADDRKQAVDEPFATIDPDTPRLALADASVDAVVCSEVLEHVHNVTATIREIHRVLKPDGVLVGSIPNFSHVASRFSFLKRHSYRIGGQFEKGGHINYLTPQFLTNFLSELFTLERHGGDEDWLSWVDFFGGRRAREAYRTLNFRGLNRTNWKYGALSYNYLFLYRKRPAK